jgi:hypothetical protein
LLDFLLPLPFTGEGRERGGVFLARKIQLTDGFRQQGLEKSVRFAIDGSPVPTGESRLVFTQKLQELNGERQDKRRPFIAADFLGGLKETELHRRGFSPDDVGRVR